MDTDVAERAITIYPAYLDADKTWAGGRRVPKSKAIERPTAREIHEVISQGLNLNCKLELTKKYSRDWLMIGRVKVDLRRSDGSPHNPSVPTKHALLVAAAELCAQRQGRAQWLVEQKRTEAHFFSGGAPAAGPKGGPRPVAQGSASKASGKPKKKGKK